MADRRKRSPVERFFRRNGLYIIIVCVLLLVVGAVLAVVGQVKRLSPAKQEEPSKISSEPVQQPAQEEPSSDASDETADEEPPVDESVYVPPFAGRTSLLADSGLVMTFDEAALSWEETEDRISLTGTDGSQKTRLDVQKLQADLSLFKQAELERICIGVVQAYYYLAPETKDFTVTDAGWNGDCFSANVNAPAYDTEAPVSARVALWKVNGQSWCVSAIVPDGEDGSAVFAAFSSIEPLGDRQLTEETP